MRKALFAPSSRRFGEVAGLLLAGSIIAPTFAAAANPCTGVAVAITDARKHEYASLVAKALNGKVKPSQVKLYSVMEGELWSAVYVSTPETDDGVLFFEGANGNKQFKDVWGGWADPSDKPELIRWAKKLGAPDTLARCFAQTVTE
ncbi:MAG: hypothetical protein QHC90_27840 [Shinella sp.]|nr:hypothetical protein [Shinella sp.]